LTFNDESLSSWSYNIDVLSPNKGKITGELPERGAKIDEIVGTMVIRKIWDGQVLISETYNSISKEAYDVAVKDLGIDVPQVCQ
jgi:hypothetical protein